MSENCFSVSSLVLHSQIYLSQIYRTENSMTIDKKFRHKYGYLQINCAADFEQKTVTVREALVYASTVSNCNAISFKHEHPMANGEEVEIHFLCRTNHCNQDPKWQAYSSLWVEGDGSSDVNLDDGDDSPFNGGNIYGSYYERLMAAIPDVSNTASKSQAFDKWISDNEEWGFTAAELTNIANKITTDNSAILGSMASHLVGTFEPHICGAANAKAVIALMTNKGINSNISSVNLVFDKLLPFETDWVSREDDILRPFIEGGPYAGNFSLVPKGWKDKLAKDSSSMFATRGKKRLQGDPLVILRDYDIVSTKLGQLHLA